MRKIKSSVLTVRTPLRAARAVALMSWSFCQLLEGPLLQAERHMSIPSPSPAVVRYLRSYSWFPERHPPSRQRRTSSGNGWSVTRCFEIVDCRSNGLHVRLPPSREANRPPTATSSFMQIQDRRRCKTSTEMQTDLLAPSEALIDRWKLTCWISVRYFALFSDMVPSACSHNAANFPIGVTTREASRSKNHQRIKWQQNVTIHMASAIVPIFNQGISIASHGIRDDPPRAAASAEPRPAHCGVFSMRWSEEAAAERMSEKHVAKQLVPVFPSHAHQHALHHRPRPGR